MASTIRGSDNFDTADNATQTELDALATGKVLQVVQGTTNATVSSTSTSFIEYTALSKSITPTSSNSKILVTVEASVRSWGGTNYNGAWFMIARDGTQITGNWLVASYDYGNSGVQTRNNVSFTYLDSPNTTSSVTYSNWGKLESGSNFGWGVGGSISTITLMEIGA